MPTVHILTKGFASPNGIAFLFPLHAHRRRLADAGIRFRCFTQRSPEVTACDALIVDSRFYSPRWANDESAALDELGAFAQQVSALLYFDISDSTGWLQSQVLPVVSRYYKAQLLVNRDAYRQPHYGNRIYGDYYHREFGIKDDDPAINRVITRNQDLAKLRVSWNSGLADYSQWGPTIMALRQRIPIDAMLRFPRCFTPPQAMRPIPLACRFGFDYARRTVSFQREKIREVMADQLATGKISRRAYLAEMRASRAVVSPFGFGEITLKDFEAMLCGALLIKPSIAHLETWPDLFHDGETMAAHRWDLSDLHTVIENVLGDDTKRIEMANNAQTRYRHHIASADGCDEFCLRFAAIIDEALESP
jgi:hypothetical protein